MTMPINEYYIRRRDDLERVRARLLSTVAERSTRLAVGARKLLERGDRKSDRPALGELVPWMLRDILGVEVEKFEDIALSWLEIYLYTILLDEMMDENVVPDSDELLAGTAIFHDGFFHLQRLVAGTKYEEPLMNALYGAAHFQLADAYCLTDPDPAERGRVSSGKNLLLLALAAAVCASSGNDKEYVLEFTSSIIPGFQFLDDIADWEMDYKRGNFTKLLSLVYERLKARTGHTPMFTAMSRSEMVHSILSTGALLDLIRETEEIIDNVILTLLPHQEAVTSLPYELLVSLRWSLQNAAKEIADLSDQLSEQKFPSHGDIEKFERTIKQIAQSS